jgi:hypothetical protein
MPNKVEKNLRENSLSPKRLIHTLKKEKYKNGRTTAS